MAFNMNFSIFDITLFMRKLIAGPIKNGTYPQTSDITTYNNIQHNIDLTLGLFSGDTDMISTRFAG